MMRCLFILMMSLLIAVSTMADQHATDAGTASELLAFDSDQQRARYYALIGELRCPKCQNQNLADSDAPIAQDLRKELHRLIDKGFSDEEILQFMTTRYGTFVLYKPPLNSHTFSLWLLPAALLLTGLLLVFSILKCNKSRLPARQSDSLQVERDEGSDIDQQVEQLIQRSERDE